MNQKDDGRNADFENDEIIEASMDDDFADDIDADDSDGEDMDFIDEEEPRHRGSPKVKKFLLPALVVVIAMGAGGYIVLNPQVLGGAKTAPAQPAPVVAQESGVPDAVPQDQAQLQQPASPADITESAAPPSGEELSFLGDLPQPAASMNEIPRPPENADFPPSGPEPVSSEPEQPASPSIAPEASALPAQQMEESGSGAADSGASPAPDQALDGAAQPVQEPDVAVAPPPQETLSEPLPVENADSSPGVALPQDVASSDQNGAAEQQAVDAQTSAGGQEGTMPVEGAAPEAAPEAAAMPPVAEEPSPAEQSAEIAGAESPAVLAETGAETPDVSSLNPAEAQAPVPAADSAALLPETTDTLPENQASGVPQTAEAPSALPSGGGEIAPATNTFYDGRIATGPMAGVGPRKVDPELEPASQFVVVKKAYDVTDMESLVVSANRALKLKRYESALDMFNQLYEKNPRDPRILMGRAVAQQHMGLSESAIRSYEEVLDVSPDNADAMLNMLGLLKQQYPSVALRRLIDLQQKYPGNASITAQIGLTYADMGKSDEAVRYLQRAAAQEPQNAQHVFNLAIIADRRGDTRGAISYYEKSLELDAAYSSGRSIPRETVYSRLSDLRRR